MDGMTTATQTLPTLGDLEQKLAAHDVALDEVAGISIEAKARGDRSSLLVLVVHRYLHDAEGRRYVVRDLIEGQHEPARDLVTIPLTALNL